MIDIKLLREQPEVVRDAIAHKKFKADIDAVLELDTVRRTKITEAEQARAAQKTATKKWRRWPRFRPSLWKRSKA